MGKLTDIKIEISIPEDIDITIENYLITIKGEKGTISKSFSHPKININLKDKKVVITCKNPRKKQKALAGTFSAHINNMIKGVSKEFEYSMKTVFSHFPIKTSVEGNKFIIQNFLGERSPRIAKILDGVTVKVNGEDITVSGIDKEKVGQTVANIERATIVRNRDIRVFQDGVYRTSKGGK